MLISVRWGVIPLRGMNVINAAPEIELGAGSFTSTRTAHVELPSLAEVIKTVVDRISELEPFRKSYEYLSLIHISEPTRPY